MHSDGFRKLKEFFVNSLLTHIISRNILYQVTIYIMAYLRQKHGSCEHLIAMFDLHGKCAKCRSKGLGSDPCVLKNVNSVTL